MDSVDKIIQDRLDVCRMADRLNLDGVEGLSVREGRKRIIKAVNPKMNLDGKSDSYINAAYDIAKQSFHELSLIHIFIRNQQSSAVKTSYRCISGFSSKNMQRRNNNYRNQDSGIRAEIAKYCNYA